MQPHRSFDPNRYLPSARLAVDHFLRHPKEKKLFGPYIANRFFDHEGFTLTVGGFWYLHEHEGSIFMWVGEPSAYDTGEAEAVRLAAQELLGVDLPHTNNPTQSEVEILGPLGLAAYRASRTTVEVS